MKITYNEYLPLDGAGTMLHPVYKWLEQERTEICHHIQKAGECYYMMSSQGYVIRSIDVTKIKRIVFGCMAADCAYFRSESYPYHVNFTKNGKHFSGMGAKDFSSVLESIRQYNRTYNN